MSDFETKLKTANTLAEAKAIAANAASIATSELFAGWNTFTYEPDIENKVEVEMKRRVAGVLCYLTDIPYKLTTNNTTYRITEIRLNLMDKQNNEISLRRINPTNGNLLPDDFGTYNGSAPETSNTICSFDLTGDNYQPDSKNELYVISTTLSNQLENTLLKGAYVLPIKNEDGKNTLELELWGKAYDENKDDNIAEGAALTKITTFPVEWDNVDVTGENKNSYSIRPNYIYHIGEKPESDSTDGDYPMSLAGTKITVTDKEWDKENVNVEFPSVPVNATMELVNEDGMAYNTDKYIFDCIGIDDVDGYGYTTESPSYPLYYPTPERLILRISPSLLKSQWRVTIYKCDEDGNIDSNPSGGEMLYINNNNSYVQEYEATQEECEDGTSLTLLLTDYADGNYFSQKKRYSKILLETLDEDGNIVATDDMVIAQYNAITVNYEGRTLGFSYYDWGVKRDLGTGVIINKGIAVQWNFLESVLSEFSNKSGYDNYTRALELSKGNFYDAFYYGENTVYKNGCAIYKAAKKRLNISNSLKVEKTTNNIWFLPAYYEMESFFQSSLYDLSWNVQIKPQKYWTSSNQGGWCSYNIYRKNNDTVGLYDVVGYDGYSISGNRNEFFYMRQACIINEN